MHKFLQHDHECISALSFAVYHHLLEGHLGEGSVFMLPLCGGGDWLCSSTHVALSLQQNCQPECFQHSSSGTACSDTVWRIAFGVAHFWAPPQLPKWCMLLALLGPTAAAKMLYAFGIWQVVGSGTTWAVWLVSSPVTCADLLCCVVRLLQAGAGADGQPKLWQGPAHVWQRGTR
jgi:hypothetical protein